MGFFSLLWHWHRSWGPWSWSHDHFWCAIKEENTFTLKKNQTPKNPPKDDFLNLRLKLCHSLNPCKSVCLTQLIPTTRRNMPIEQKFAFFPPKIKNKHLAAREVLMRMQELNWNLSTWVKKGFFFSPALHQNTSPGWIKHQASRSLWFPWALAE